MKKNSNLPSNPNTNSVTSISEAIETQDSLLSPMRQRQEMIIKLVKETGFATIDALSRRFQVTPQTIRRDINMLSDEGLLNRYHGGAGLSSSTENFDYTERKILCQEEKRRIAQTVSRHIPNNSSLFINIGTTTEEVARALIGHKKLKVITNNLYVASILSGNENFEVIVTGGMVRHKDGGIVGISSVDFIQQFKVDYGIIGISGIDMDGTLLDFDYREVRAARAIIDNSRNVFLVADHTKFGRNAMVRLGNITEITALFTDAEPPAPLRESLMQADVTYYLD